MAESVTEYGLWSAIPAYYEAHMWFNFSFIYNFVVYFFLSELKESSHMQVALRKSWRL